MLLLTTKMLSSSSSYFLLLVVFIIAHSSTAITWNNACENPGQCSTSSGTGGWLCSDSRCRCETPWFTPCNQSRCDLRTGYSYQGEGCRNDINCVANAECRENLCQCRETFTGYNGLCYKGLNETCRLGTECWSRSCINERCVCRPGYVNKDGSRCERKLAKIYDTFEQANAASDFCYEPGSVGCLAPWAVCINNTGNNAGFCKCPIYFNANYEKQECTWKESDQLSPIREPLATVQDCGTCKDPNALCVTVDTQRTCWCRAGYRKVGETCQSERSTLLFPNRFDSTQHNFDSNCTSNDVNNSFVISNGLCSCAPGYAFQRESSACRPIVPDDFDQYFEHGVCSRIDSYGRHVGSNGLCPLPLTCDARTNKFVCSCGSNRYLDKEKNECFYFLNRFLGVGAVAAQCPENSDLNTNSTCQCKAEFVARNGQTCVIVLNQMAASINGCRSDIACDVRFGGNAQWCVAGECRCIPENAYATPSRCITFIGRPGARIDDDCPAHATESDGLCQCDNGYRAASDNRTCERKTDLLYDSSIPEQPTQTGDLSTDDCIALFPNMPVKTDNTGRCKCRDNNAFLTENKCISYLGVNPALFYKSCPENAWFSTNGICECDTGYRNSGNNRTCEVKTTNLYVNNDPAAVNVSGLTDSDCRFLFGNAAKANRPDGYCTCIEQQAFPSNNRCYFYVETDVFAVDDRTCPPTSEQGSQRCVCPVGSWPIGSKEGCAPKPIVFPPLTSIERQSMPSLPCNASYSDADCEALVGPGAVCYDNRCYCERRLSFVSGNRCVPFSTRRFPGVHERNLYTCSKNSDCDTNPDENGIECGYINPGDNYKVCRCKNDYWLDPGAGRCVRNQRCIPGCGTNEECRGYVCECVPGFYRNPPNGPCVQIPTPLSLYEPCNATIWSNAINSESALKCSPSCSHAECNTDFRNNDNNCVRYSFEDRCGIQDSNFCSGLISNSECNIDENQCICSSGFYRTSNGQTCARALNGQCGEDNECGQFAECLDQRCRCRTNQREEQFQDTFGRTYLRCISGVGNPIHLNRLLLLLMLVMIVSRRFFS